MQTYKIQVTFPSHFTQQTLLLQFDLYDTCKEGDYANIDRITKNLERVEMEAEKARSVADMKRISKLESKKSMIGRINADDLRRADLRINDILEGVARDNNIGSNFFSFEESQFKIKKADWLNQVCFEPAISEAVKRQSLHFNKVDQYDGLLESAFNFLDVNDSSSVNRIIDEAAQTHV